MSNPLRTRQAPGDPPGPAVRRPHAARGGCGTGGRAGSPIRLAWALVMSVCAAAVFLGRREDPAAGRVPAPARYVVVSGQQLEPEPCSATLDAEDCSTTFLCDGETGQVLRWRRPGRKVVQYAACSPWVDEQGRRQVAAVLWSRSPQGLLEWSGIARMSESDAAIIDLVDFDSASTSPPCWAPGTGAVIYFAASDGRIYRHDFDGSRSRPTSLGSPDPKPFPLAWHADGRNPGAIRFFDLTAPADPRLDAYLLAAVESPIALGAGDSVGGRELWWLRLDHDRTSIEAAGRLLEPGSSPAGSAPGDRRCPVLATQPDGSLVLASLARQPNARTYQLRMAPLRFDPQSGAPRVVAGEERTLAEGCVAVSPCFSADGQWVSCFLAARSHLPIFRRALRLTVGRVADPAALPARKAPEQASRPQPLHARRDVL